MPRKERLIRKALHIAQDADPRCNYKIAAIVARGNRPIAWGCCTSRSDPKNPKLSRNTKHTQLCAEVVAIIRAIRMLGSLLGCSIYVARRKSDGSFGMAKPCPICQRFMKDNGISRAYFTTDHGTIEKL